MDLFGLLLFSRSNFLSSGDFSEAAQQYVDILDCGDPIAPLSALPEGFRTAGCMIRGGDFSCNEIARILVSFFFGW